MTRQLRRWSLRILVYGSLFFVGLPIMFSFIMTATHPRDRLATPPAHYDAVSVRSGDLELRAWLADGAPDKPPVILVHGLGDNLESYQEHAQPFRDRGHPVLLLDLRGHGGSEGRHTTLGGLESDDVRAAMDYLGEAGLARPGIIIMGHSMGAVSVILAAADRNDVAAVIAEAPFDSFRNTVAHHAKLLYRMPAWLPIIPLAIRAAEWRAGFVADDVDCVKAAARMNAPFLAIADGLDQRMPEPVIRRIVDAHPGPNQMWVAEDVDHVGSFWNPDWEETVFGFLARHELSTL